MQVFSRARGKPSPAARPRRPEGAEIDLIGPPSQNEYIQVPAAGRALSKSNLDKFPSGFLAVRLLTHRGLVCPKWLEHMFAVLGVCSLQDTPARWVAVHRRHHEHADLQSDPHSPLVDFGWGHMGWLVVENRDLMRLGIFARYAKDILRDPFYARLERKLLTIWLVLISWSLFFVGGVMAALLSGGNAIEALQFGLSLLIWGVFVRTVLVWHITWSVNSVTHLWGYRNYETDDASRNNVIVGIVSNGEGWHNNHHADPRSARHGHLWWEVDVTWVTIRFLAAVGLAREVVVPSPHVRQMQIPHSA